MKKLSNKQKLIGGIAIILIAVILAIVITTNIIVNNNQSNQLASQEDYLATTANAGSSLVASYIKKGITIGGITGTLETLDTNDATAYAEDIAYGKVAYARGERIVGTYVDPISNEDLQISSDNVYYADLDSSGEITVDGVIFADLAGEEERGKWNNDSFGSYIIPSEAGLKQYYIKGEYTDEHFGTGKVIAPMEETSGNDRFYVMSLEDINPGTKYCWYDAAVGNLDSSYNVSPTADDFAVAGAEPTGRINTKRMIASWNAEEYGAQNDNSTYDDIWGVIQDEVARGWFVPSKSEWSAFGATFEITSSNYSSTYGLGDYYWSSSQNITDGAYIAGFYAANIYIYTLNYSYYVRLATIF